MTASLSLRSEPAELRRLLAFAAEFARRHAISAPQQSRLAIIVEELFTNAARHGYEGRSDLGRIEVALACDGGQLTIDFKDDGRPFEPLTGTLPDLDQPASKRGIGGLGLHIVRSLVDEARYSREGGHNHLVLTRKIADPGGDDESG